MGGEFYIAAPNIDIVTTNISEKPIREEITSVGGKEYHTWVYRRENPFLNVEVMDWINCKECAYFEDCENKEDRDGCYFGKDKRA